MVGRYQRSDFFTATSVDRTASWDELIGKFALLPASHRENVSRPRSGTPLAGVKLLPPTSTAEPGARSVRELSPIVPDRTLDRPADGILPQSARNWLDREGTILLPNIEPIR